MNEEYIRTQWAIAQAINRLAEAVEKQNPSNRSVTVPARSFGESITGD